MTVLSGVTAAPGSEPSGVELKARLITLQCDTCCPPFVATNTLEMLHRSGWTTVLGGATVDTCHVCNRRSGSFSLVRRADRAELSEDHGGTLPNLVVIGAAKCATTSLHRYLDSHSDISMSPVKEPQFFQDPDGEDWLGYYRAQFDPTARITGESSTMYSRHPAIPGVPQRMAARIPDAKLVYMVRDPIERAISSFVEERTHDNDFRTLELAFGTLESKANPYVAASQYAMQLRLYLEFYPWDQIMVVEMLDLERDPGGTLVRLHEFLDVTPDAHVADAAVRVNTRDEKRQYSPTIRRLRRSPLLKAAYRLPERPREAILAPLRKSLSTKIDRPHVPDKLRRDLRDALAADADEFRRMTGQSFSEWSV